MWSIPIIQKTMATNYTTVDPKQLHKSHMKFWRQAQSTDTPDQLENRMGQKTGLGDEPRRRTQHPRPDGRQAGRQDQRQEKDKPRGGRHSIPDERQATRQNKDKSWGDKTRDKRKTRPGRRTEHPRPDGRQAGRQDRKQEKDKTSQADTASQTRWETRWETRPEASLAKRTQHPSQGGHTKKALRTPTVNCLGEKSHGDPRARSQ